MSLCKYYPDAEECADEVSGGAGAGPLSQPSKRHLKGVSPYMSRALGEGRSDALRLMPPMTLLVDSRDRDRYGFPNASHFVMKMTRLNGVRRITLNMLRVPIKAGAMGLDAPQYVVLTVIPGGDAFTQPAMSPQFPSEALAVIPLVPDVAGGTFTTYRKHCAEGEFSINCPSGKTMNRLEVGVWTWLPQALTVPPTPSGIIAYYPFVNEPMLPAETLVSINNNFVMVLDIEYENRSG